MGNESIRYLIVPGWQGSSDDHWQTHWQNSLPNSARVEQADWLTPRREDWIAALAEAIAADSTPVILIAHSLGCITVAHWAERAPASLQVTGYTICRNVSTYLSTVSGPHLAHSSLLLPLRPIEITQPV